MQIHEIHKVEEKNMAENININTSNKGVAAQSTDITSVTETLVLDERNTEISKTNSLSAQV